MTKPTKQTAATTTQGKMMTIRLEKVFSSDSEGAPRTREGLPPGGAAPLRIFKTANCRPKDLSAWSLDAAAVKVIAVCADAVAGTVTVINMEPLVLLVLTTTMSSAGIPSRFATSDLKAAAAVVLFANVISSIVGAGVVPGDVVFVGVGAGVVPVYVVFVGVGAGVVPVDLVFAGVGAGVVPVDAVFVGVGTGVVPVDVVFVWVGAGVVPVSSELHCPCHP